MALPAARQALAAAGLDPADVELVIVATVTPDMFFPSTGSLVAAELGSPDAAAYDLSAGCTGFMYALAQAYGALAGGLAQNAVVIGAETLSKIMNWHDRTTCVLFGDGAGAVVLEHVADGGFLGFELGSDGEGGKELSVPAGGSRNPTSVETVEQGLHFLRMNGREVYKFATRVLVSSAEKLLEECGLTVADVDLYIGKDLHQSPEVREHVVGLDPPLSRGGGRRRAATEGHARPDDRHGRRADLGLRIFGLERRAAIVKVAFCFPGQGSQNVGMGRAMAEEFPQAQAVFDEASEAVGFDVARLCFEGPIEELTQTELQQPALVTTSLACLRAVETLGVRPDFVVGHSVGEYSALAAAEALSDRDAIALVGERGRATADAARDHPGAMAAVLGLEDAVVEELCAGIENVLQLPGPDRRLGGERRR